MKKHWMKWSCMAVLVLTSCQQGNLSEEISTDNLALGLQASIAGEIFSRTSTQEDGHTTFVQGDKIGLFMPEETNAVLWTLGESSWQPSVPLFWPDQKHDYSFCAFYPYAEEAERTSIPMPDLSTQDGELEHIGKYDFLVAKKTCSYQTNAGKVSFTDEAAFRHIYSLVMVTLVKNEKDAETTLKTVAFEGKGILSKHTYDFTEKQMQPVAEAPEADNLLLEIGAEGTVIPQEGYSIAVLLNPTEADGTLKFSITYERDGIAYQAYTEAMKGHLVGGNCYKYKIKIEKESLIIEGSEVSDWQTEGETEDIIVNDVPKDE